MTYFLIALAAVGALALVIAVALPTYLVVAVKLDRRAETRRRAEQGRQVDAAYIASLAADEPTPVFDRLMCESMEKAEGWS